MNSFTLSELHDCVVNRWSPQIGDPTAMGWFTVAAYFATAWMCFAAGRARVQDRGFWVFLGLVLLLLGVNKQFDFQSALTATGRCVSQLQGWYEERRRFQFLFIVGLLVVSGIVFLFVMSKMIARLHRVGVALFGFGALSVFVLVRAVGFYRFDALIGTSLLGARMNWVLELGGIALILLNAVVASFGARDLPRKTKGREQSS